MPDAPILAVSSAPLWRTPLETAFAIIREAGGEGVEILVTHDLDTQSPNILEKLANQYDLPIVALHAPLLLLTRQVYTSDPLEKIRRTVEMTKALDVGAIVLHPPYRWQLRYSLWLLHELEDTVASSKTAITMENMYPVQVGRRQIGFHRFLDLRHLERFEDVTLDTSHLGVAGLDIVDAYRQLAHRVVHVHLSDNRGKGRDSHAPIGQGVLPIADFVRALDHPKLRSIALEVNAGPAEDDRDKLTQLIADNVALVRSNLPSRTAGSERGLERPPVATEPDA